MGRDASRRFFQYLLKQIDRDPLVRYCTLNAGTIYPSRTPINNTSCPGEKGAVRTVSKFLCNLEPISRSVRRMQQWHSPKIVEAKLPQRWRCDTWLRSCLGREAEENQDFVGFISSMELS